MQVSNLLAIEVGSSRVKLGWFPADGACTSEKPAGNLPIAAPVLPEPAEVFRIEHRRDERQWIGEVESRLAELALPSETVCVLAAVHQLAAETLRAHVLARQPWSRIETLTRGDIAIEVDVKEPARVGIDRLLTALAVNRVRPPQLPAIVVDMGTAMTVNLISEGGVFQGGAILAGPMTALGALHTATSSLPMLGPEVLESPPPAVGISTNEAMASGAYWGAIGAARQLIERMAATCTLTPEVFLTGGAARGLAAHVGLGDRPARHLPQLVLSGIRLAADGKLRP
ncbi:MAG: type III pantothenate kinase [Pirellulales bacterium]|nr:type III pantothenate kinase [Pirellulales bacterium]